ncbi:MAG: LCP family protein [Candidatus Doudnabacteria bacterium]
MKNFDLIKPQLQQQVQNNNHFDPIVQKPHRRTRKWKWIILILVILALAGFASSKLLLKTNQIFTGKGNIFTRVGNLILSPDKKLIGEDEGQINILLMGIGGSGHDGAYLTDTMIVASINTKTNEVVLISIPRDFALDLPKVGYNKVNAAYAYAYKDNPNTAGDAAIDAAEKITNLQIPYYAVIDFRGFVKAVDDVGGVDVTVDNTFTDSSFPNDYPYDTTGYLAPVTFTKGPQHMNGQRALIFARSRHSENADEGSDFARSERQKKILVALKNKILSLKLTNLPTINNLLSDFTDNFRTNMEPYELKHLTDLAQKTNNDNIYSFSLDPDGVLICSALVDPQTGKKVPEPAPAPAPTSTPTPPPATGASAAKTTAAVPTAGSVPTVIPTDTTPAVTEPEVVRMYVVQPCEGKTLTDIHDWLVNAPVMAKLNKEKATVEIQTSTGKPISPTRFKQLSLAGIDVKYAIFKGKVAYNQTVLYDNTKGSKPKTLDYLNSNYTLTPSDVTYPASTADFVIIVGKDSS